MRILPQQKSIEQHVEAVTSILRGQPRRLVWHLHKYGPSYTSEISSTLAIGNVSAAASTANEALRSHGLVIVANLPEKLLVNRYGEKSMSHVWRLAQLRG